MSLSTKDKEKIIAALDKTLEVAQSNKFNISNNEKKLIDSFNSKIDKATSAFTNIVTCLAMKVCDNSIDVRYHRKPGEKDKSGGIMPPPPSGENDWFSGRSISEKIVAPWLEDQKFRTAKSGWQTRTFERPKPYTFDYSENIAHVQDSFFNILNLVQNKTASALNVLAYFFFLEIKEKDAKENAIAKLSRKDLNNNSIIQNLINAFQIHFQTDDSARLPVLAIYATYQTILSDIKRYHGCELLPLGNHAAADSRTGAIGDIEIINSEKNIIEGIEIKHNIPIDKIIANTARKKISDSTAERYYILTTHSSCSVVNSEVQQVIEEIQENNGCQMIVNGVLPTMKYYLRLAENPEKIVAYYSELLKVDSRVKTHHIESWTNLIDNL